MILASKSPYRLELLGRLAFSFDTKPSHVNEDKYKSENYSPLDLTKVLAKAKAQKVFEKFPDSIVIGSDQISLLEGKILGKPKTFENACHQLSSMSGKTHDLITSVCVLTPEKVFEFYDKTTLTMRSLTPEQIESYVRKDKPLDCAGSYKIESLGVSLFTSIQTDDFTAITGLPLIKLSQILRELEIII